MYAMIVIVMKYFKNLVYFNVLAEELTDLHVHTKLPVFNKECTTFQKKVTTVSTLNKVLKKKMTSKKCLLQIHKINLLRYSSCFGFCRKRSFNVVRRIKTWLRTFMTDNSLNN